LRGGADWWCKKARWYERVLQYDRLKFRLDYFAGGLWWRWANNRLKWRGSLFFVLLSGSVNSDTDTRIEITFNGAMAEEVVVGATANAQPFGQPHRVLGVGHAVGAAWGAGASWKQRVAIDGGAGSRAGSRAGAATTRAGWTSGGACEGVSIDCNLASALGRHARG